MRMGTFSGTDKQMVDLDQHQPTRKVEPVPTTITARLEQHYQRCNSPRRRAQVMTRWATIPALAGLSPDDIIDICERPTIDQNPVVAALIGLHQNGDHDATTVLMTVLRPMVLATAVKRCGRRIDDAVDNDWAAVGHMLGSIDADSEPLDANGQPDVFLTHLGKRLGLSRRRLDPPAQRWLIRRQRGTGPKFVLSHPGAISGEFEIRGGPTTDTSVEDEVLARIELDRIARVVATGQIPRSRWNQLVAHRVSPHPETVASGQTRVAVHRTAHRLARLVDHAA